MRALSFPDPNVWMALLVADHVHRPAAVAWWNQDQSEIIAFSRVTQITVLRLLTTSGVMNGQPLSMKAAWNAYDRLFEDARVAWLPEPPDVEEHFRKHTASRIASPKLWADAYLLALAHQLDGTLVTFDRALATRDPRSLLLS